jgi:hypothetical protein
MRVHINVTRLRRRRASVTYNDKMFWSSNRLRIFIQQNEYVWYCDARYWTNTLIIIFRILTPTIFYDLSSLQFPTWYAHTYMKICWSSNDHSRYTFKFMTTVIKQKKNIDDLSSVQWYSRERERNQQLLVEERLKIYALCTKESVTYEYYLITDKNRK